MSRARQSDDRPMFGHEQEAAALGVIDAADDFDFNPADYAGPLGMPFPNIPGMSFKWVTYVEPGTGKEDPKEIMRHRSPAMGMWDFVRPEEWPEYQPAKITHGTYGAVLASQGMIAMKIPTVRRDKIVAYHKQMSDRLTDDIYNETGTQNAPQDSRSPFSLKVERHDQRMRTPQVRE